MRLFREYKNITPYEFLIKCKIEKARSLLLSSSHNISRIADITGYRNIYHFSKQFKNRTGIAPSVYRKEKN
ncbi:MAG: helix-turn-helix domain-containing protein [Bacillota bacterium]